MGVVGGTLTITRPPDRHTEGQHTTNNHEMSETLISHQECYYTRQCTPYGPSAEGKYGLHIVIDCHNGIVVYPHKVHDQRNLYYMASSIVQKVGAVDTGLTQ